MEAQGTWLDEVEAEFGAGLTGRLHAVWRLDASIDSSAGAAPGIVT